MSSIMSVLVLSLVSVLSLPLAACYAYAQCAKRIKRFVHNKNPYLL